MTTLVLTADYLLKKKDLSNSVIEIEGGTTTIASNLNDLNEIDLGGGAWNAIGGTLNLGDDNLTVATFGDSAGGVVEGAGNLSITGNASFQGQDDVMTGAGITRLEGVTSFLSGEILLDGGRTLINQGNFNAQSNSPQGSTIYLGWNSYGASTGVGTFENAAGATMTVSNFAIWDQGPLYGEPAPNQVVNHGLIEVTGNNQNSDIAAQLINNGTIQVDAGDILLIRDSYRPSGPDLIGGTLTGAGYLQFSASEVLLTAHDVSLGILAIYGGVTLGVNISDPGELLLYGALDLDDHAMTVGSLDFGGQILGSGSLTVTGGATFEFTGGYLIGDGVTRLEGATSAQGDFRVSGDHVLDILSTFTIGRGANFGFSLGENLSTPADAVGTVKVEAGAVLNAIGRFGVNDVGPGAGIENKFINQGLVELGGNGNYDSFLSEFVNTGQVTIGATDVMQLQQDSQTLNGAFSGDGTLELSADAKLATADITVANLLIDAGTTALRVDFAYTGALTLNGAAIDLGGHSLSAAAFNQSHGQLLGGGSFAFSGSDDALTLDNGETIASNGDGNAFVATQGDVVAIGAATGDVLQGAGFIVRADGAAAFSFGGGGVSGIRDRAEASEDMIGVLANSNARVVGSDDTITSAGGSVLKARGDDNLVIAGADDQITVRGADDRVQAGLDDLITLRRSGAEALIGGAVGILNLGGLHGSDVIDLLNGVGGFVGGADAYAALSDDGAGDSTLSLGSNGTVVLQGVTKEQLSSANFQVG